MITSFPHLPESQEKKFRHIISRIVKDIEPEKIICYGTRTWLNHTWSSLAPAPHSEMDTDYDLLIITRADEKRRENEILDIINHYSNADMRLIAIVHTMSFT